MKSIININFKTNKLFIRRPMNVMIRWSFYFVTKKWSSKFECVKVFEINERGVFDFMENKTSF
ncbi:hypothetical protein COL93_04050 [Bacillus toyonensis]|uniref:Uncharacterized protein n=1 Tax=Bacillus toyonensis TaxID=155322 RepID=A0A2B5Y5T3_9BACI|nr:hypothetical protein COL93_04050 [Bacillus toyonensis]PHD70304.1 hypothetical protein COF40_12515 [Bacillus toyonensis]